MLFCMVFGVGLIFIGQKVLEGKLLGTPALWRKRLVGGGYRIILLHQTFGRGLILAGVALVILALFFLV